MRCLGLERQGVFALAMRPEATLGTFEKIGEGGPKSATPMSGGCPMLPSRGSLHRTKNKFSNVNRYKFKAIVNASNLLANLQSKRGTAKKAHRVS
jgi:hypothetical protein